MRGGFGAEAAGPRPISSSMPISTDVVEVPYTSLHPETLRAVVVEFITRAATDYGERERTLEEKIADVMRQLEHGEATLVFDPRTNSVNVVPVAGARNLRR